MVAGSGGSARAALPGLDPCLTNVVPPDYGTFVLLKTALYTQEAGSEPVEAPEPSAFASIRLVSPASYSISNAIVTGPGGFRANLVLRPGGVSEWSDGFATESELNAALRDGAWSASFQVVFPDSDPFVGFFPFTLGAAEPPVPHLTGLDGLGAVNPAQALAISWDSWMGASTNDRVSLALVDSQGEIAFLAATDCAGDVTLDLDETSVIVPAGTLSPGATYTGYLTFAVSTLADQDDSALQVQRGFQGRTTQFTLRTTGSGPGGELGTISDVTLTSSNIVFTLTGTPGATYIIQSSGDLAGWTDEASVVLPGSGTAEVELTLEPGGPARFYRAITEGGSQPGEPASLEITRASETELELVLTGDPGATYTIESTTDHEAWEVVREVTVPAGTNRVVVPIPITTDPGMRIFRATTDSAPPVPGDGPAMVLTADDEGLLLAVSDAEPGTTYVIERADPDFKGWSEAGVSITTDAQGEGSVRITPDPEAAAAFFRARVE